MVSMTILQITSQYLHKIKNKMEKLFAIPCLLEILSDDDQQISHDLLYKHLFNIQNSAEIDFSKSGSTQHLQANHIVQEDLAPVKKIFDNYIKRYIKSCNNGKGVKYFYTNSWYNFIAPNNMCPPHFHPSKSADITGIYYPSFNKEFGDLQIFNPNLIQPVNLAAFNFLRTIECKSGLLILFPACLLHQSQVNKSEELRISFVFDIFLNPNNLTEEHD